MHRRPRKLSPEERELWAQVAASAVALHARRAPIWPNFASARR
jgi:hypothetical protein